MLSYKNRDIFKPLLKGVILNDEVKPYLQYIVISLSQVLKRNFKKHCLILWKSIFTKLKKSIADGYYFIM